MAFLFSLVYIERFFSFPSSRVMKCVPSLSAIDGYLSSSRVCVEGDSVMH